MRTVSRRWVATYTLQALAILSLALASAIVNAANLMVHDSNSLSNTASGSALVAITEADGLLRFSYFPWGLGLLFTAAALVAVPARRHPVDSVALSNRSAFRQRLDQLVASLEEMTDEHATTSLELERVESRPRDNQALIDLTREHAAAVRAGLTEPQERGYKLQILFFVIATAVAIALGVITLVTH
jgi:hypothetical protein